MATDTSTESKFNAILHEGVLWCRGPHYPSLSRMQTTYNAATDLSYLRTPEGLEPIFYVRVAEEEKWAQLLLLCVADRATAANV